MAWYKYRKQEWQIIHGNWVIFSHNFEQPYAEFDISRIVYYFNYNLFSQVQGEKWRGFDSCSVVKIFSLQIWIPRTIPSTVMVNCVTILFFLATITVN